MWGQDSHKKAPCGPKVAQSEPNGLQNGSQNAPTSGPARKSAHVDSIQYLLHFGHIGRSWALPFSVVFPTRFRVTFWNPPKSTREGPLGRLGAKRPPKWAPKWTRLFRFWASGRPLGRHLEHLGASWVPLWCPGMPRGPLFEHFSLICAHFSGYSWIFWSIFCLPRAIPRNRQNLKLFRVVSRVIRRL